MLIIIHLIFQKIYRCWIVWGCSIHVVIVPSFLAFAFLGTLIYLHSLSDLTLWFLAICIVGGTAPLSFVQDQYRSPEWTVTLAIAGLALSMTVNALMTALIVFRISKVFQKVKTGTADDQISGMTSGNTLGRIVFIIIESGMALFSIQLARLVVTIATTHASEDAYFFIIGIHEMLSVIISSFIVTLSY